MFVDSVTTFVKCRILFSAVSSSVFSHNQKRVVNQHKYFQYDMNAARGPVRPIHTFTPPTLYVACLFTNHIMQKINCKLKRKKKAWHVISTNASFADSCCGGVLLHGFIRTLLALPLKAAYHVLLTAHHTVSPISK